MDIQFSSHKLQRVFNSGRQLLREYGKDSAKKIRLRMAVLRSAKCLADVPKHPPDRCHALKGERAGQYAVDLNHPFRLVFEPIRIPGSVGFVDEAAVTAIRIVKVEDYH